MTSIDEIRAALRECLPEIREKYGVTSIGVFGSYARGNAKEHSEIDLAIISDWFRGRPNIENMQFLSKLAARYNSLVEALPFTEEEYSNLDSRTFLASIVKSGKKQYG